MAAENNQPTDDQLRENYLAALNQTIISPIAEYGPPEEARQRLEVARKMLNSGMVQVVVGGFANPVPREKVEAVGSKAIVNMAINLAQSNQP